MHEMSIAQSIVDIVEAHLKKENATQIVELTIDIGVFSGIEYHALEFALQCIQENSILKSANIILNRINGKAQCNDCKHLFTTKQLHDNCPQCNGYFTNVVEGKELKIKSMVVN